ncbi:MAG: GIY-YIG nuclease family protein, partial [Waterburya sp.]
MTCGVYQIKNKLDGKIYIGSSADIERRWEGHKKMLRTKKHYNSKLQEAWDKYGEETFTFEILSVTDYVNLKNEEQDFLNHLREEKSYNKHKIANRRKCLIQDNALNNPTCIHPGCNRVLYSKGKDEHGNTRYRCLNGHSQRVKPTRTATHFCPACGKGLKINRV